MSAMRSAIVHRAVSAWGAGGRHEGHVSTGRMGFGAESGAFSAQHPVPSFRL